MMLSSALIFVSTEFQRSEEIGAGTFSVMRKAIWKKRSMEVALKDLQSREKLEVRDIN